MPKPTTVLQGRMDELLEVISEERRMLQQLADEQYATMGRCMRASFARIEDLDAIKGGGNVLRKTETNHANQKLQARDDPLQPALEWATEETDHEHHHRPQSQMSHMTTTKSEATTENLHLYEGMADRGKAYTDVLAGTLVLLNSFVMLIELEIEGQAVGALLSGGHGPKLADVSPIFKTLDGIFVFVFLAELLMRIGIERKKFIYDAANWFDSVLVVAGLVDMFIILPLSKGEDQQSIVMLRMVRALKSLRAIRLVRTFRFFRGLRMLVKACYCFLPSLGWSMVLLVVFMWMGTLVLGNLLQDFITDESQSLEDRMWIWNRYGTAYRAMYTLYEITFAGNWPTNARPVLEKVNHAYVIFYLVYITIIVFAAIRVISAVFLKDTLEAARNDDETQVVERLRHKAKYVRKLQDLFQAIGGSKDSMITEERLADILTSPKALAYLQTLDVDVTESAALFSLLDNGDGEITQEEFIDGILRCKGPARAIDQVALRADVKQLDSKLHNLARDLQTLVKTKLLESRSGADVFSPSLNCSSY